jgi:hypothetical protein
MEYENAIDELTGLANEVYDKVVIIKIKQS